MGRDLETSHARQGFRDREAPRPLTGRVIHQVRPTMLIALQGKLALSPSPSSADGRHTDRPIIFPLSVRVALSEATPADLNAD